MTVHRLEAMERLGRERSDDDALQVERIAANDPRRRRERALEELLHHVVLAGRRETAATPVVAS